MSDSEIIGTAYVTLKVEITGLGAWGPDCRIDQVQKQAADSAIGYVRNRDLDRRIRIIGNPEVTAVLARRRDDSSQIAAPWGWRERLAARLRRLAEWVGGKP